MHLFSYGLFLPFSPLVPNVISNYLEECLQNGHIFLLGDFIYCLDKLLFRYIPIYYFNEEAKHLLFWNKGSIIQLKLAKPTTTATKLHQLSKKKKNSTHLLKFLGLKILFDYFKVQVQFIILYIYAFAKLGNRNAMPGTYMTEITDSSYCIPNVTHLPTRIHTHIHTKKTHNKLISSLFWV